MCGKDRKVFLLSTYNKENVKSNSSENSVNLENETVSEDIIKDLKLSVRIIRTNDIELSTVILG